MRGLTEWRVPTIDEARALAGGCANTAPGGSCPLSDSTPCLDQSCGQSSECTSCVASGGPHNGSYCRAEVTICSGFHTTSECTDCASPGNWRYAPGNGNFHASSTTSLTHAVCVMDDVPHGVPCSD